MTEPKRDRFGRYVLLDPNTGEERVWTRATTFADALEDSYGLTKWKQRGTAVGIGLRKDLLAIVQSHTMEDKRTLDEACESALKYAAADSRSNLGTALHKMTERLDRGEDFNVPADYADHMATYHKLKSDNDLQTAPQFVERITVVPEFSVAGTMDRIVRYKGAVRIADLKTGADLKYGWTKIAVQLALYSRGAGLWNEKNGTWEQMPLVEQDWGVVIHLPADDPQRAGLWKVDLNAGWEAAQRCAWVRDWRKRKDLAERISA